MKAIARSLDIGCKARCPLFLLEPSTGAAGAASRPVYRRVFFASESVEVVCEHGREYEASNCAAATVWAKPRHARAALRFFSTLLSR